ncbi:putative RRM domain-containing protein [Seiridium cardinale]|uniref:RRM domain-containing protein n=1 Tax=Seiridium cardinale TaxID=138064 RepID=A0ABR2X6G5_9PEZI
MAAPSLSFPTNLDEFETDDRISFSKLDNKYIAVQDDGTEFEFDTQLKRWIPTLDEEELAAQRRMYGGSPDDDQADSTENGNKRKRKEEAAAARKKQKAPPQPRQNTAIYVTGLPFDATVDEVHDVFSRKCGVIAEEIDSGRPRIKMYTDNEGKFKGDALVVFFKPQSVEMAIMLLDDTDFRYSASGTPSGKMKVQAADSSYKKTQHEAAENTSGATGGGDAANGAAAKAVKDRREREQEKQKIIKRTQKLDAKLADWDDDEPYGAQLETSQRKDKVVVLRHMFTLQELEEDPAALLDIKDDIREECEKLGAVTSVTLYDLEEDGVVSVKFQTPQAAEACIELMDGRAFDGRVVRATFATGGEKYKKSGKDRTEEDV